MIISLNTLTEDQSNEVSMQLSRIFNAFDRLGSGIVPMEEILSGIMVLTSGKKSDKLFTCWNLFCVRHEERLLGRRELWKYFRSFLTVILVFIETVQQLSSEQVLGIIDDTSIEATGLIFKGLEINSNKKISFEEFGNWYNQYFHESLQWLELLDHSKWPKEEVMELDVEQHASNVEKVMYMFSLNNSNKDDRLLVTTEDCDFIVKLITKSGLENYSPEDVHNYFVGTVGSTFREIDEATFFDIMETLRTKVNPHDECVSDAFLSLSYAAIFDVFNTNSSGFISVTIMARAMSFFSKGSKSGKLYAAFSLRDKIYKSDLIEVLGSFLTLVVALTLKRRISSTDVIGIVERTCSELADLALDNKECISFEEFGEWYNEGGYKLAPWLELLDLNKCFLNYSHPHDEAHGEENQSATDPSTYESSVEETHNEDEDVVFTYILNANNDQLTFNSLDVSNFLYLIEETSLSNFSAQEIIREFLNCSDIHQRLSKVEFDRVIRTLIPSETVVKANKMLLSLAFRKLFYAFELSGTQDEVDAKQIACGFTIFAMGNKSSKLAECFSLLDSNEDGVLSYDETYVYITSFLRTLCSLSREIASLDLTKCNEIIHSTVMCILSSLFAHYPGGRVSFDQFAEWYSAQGGMDLMPWIELFTPSKWNTQGRSSIITNVKYDIDSSKEISVYSPLSIDKNDCTSLQINENDCLKMSSIVSLTNFKNTSPEEIMNELLDHKFVVPGLHLKSSSWRELKSLFTASNLEVDYGKHEIVNKWFDSLLLLLLHDGESASAQDLASAFSVLTNGSKSDKLASSFSWHDTDNDGYLSQIEMKRSI